MADAVTFAKQDQKPPSGYYNLELMLNAVPRQGKVLLCGTCMDTRGLSDDDILVGSQRGTMDELSELSLKPEKPFVF